MSELGASGKVLRGRRIIRHPGKKKVRLFVFLFLYTRCSKQVFVILWVHRRTWGQTSYTDSAVNVPIWGMADTKLGSTWSSVSKGNFLFQIHVGTQFRFSSPASIFVFFPDNFKEKKIWFPHRMQWADVLSLNIALFCFPATPLFCILGYIKPDSLQGLLHSLSFKLGAVCGQFQ